jgi:hypothetical protein
MAEGTTKAFPFTDYDFWGYLSSGFVTLFALDYSLGTDLLAKPSWTFVEGVIAVSLAYVTGHLVAGISSAVFEQQVVLALGRPSEVLTGTAVAPRWARFVFPSYFAPLPPGTLSALKAKAQSAGHTDLGSLFTEAHRKAQKNPKAAERLAVFLNQYGFCRNVSFALLIAAVAFALCAVHIARPNAWLWAGCSAFASVGMFLRYLKFHRLFSVEVFTSYTYD